MALIFSIASSVTAKAPLRRPFSPPLRRPYRSDVCPEYDIPPGPDDLGRQRRPAPYRACAGEMAISPVLVVLA
jgi:hypothetical protein